MDYDRQKNICVNYFELQTIKVEVEVVVFDERK